MVEKKKTPLGLNNNSNSLRALQSRNYDSFRFNMYVLSKLVNFICGLL